jgi:predicted PurR-regulated permease PerM
VTQPEVEESFHRWRRVGVVAWSLIGIAALVVGALWLLSQLSAALAPLVVGVVVVFFLKGWVQSLVNRGMDRTAATAVAYLGAALVVALFFLFVIPPIAQQVTAFVEAFPAFYESARDFFNGLIDRYSAVQWPGWVADLATRAQEAASERAAEWAELAAEGVFAAGSSTVQAVFTVALGLVIGFYLLRGLPRIKEGTLRLLSEPHQRDAREITDRVTTVVGGFIRGQIIVSFFVGVLIGLGMWVAGVPFPGVIGLIGGVFNVIPYFGPIVAGFVAAVAALFVDPILALWAILVVVVVNQIESMFLAPRIMSQQVDVHPVVVILAVVAGASLFGIIGMLLAVPVAAAAKAVGTFYLEKYGWTPLPPEEYDTRPLHRKLFPFRKEASDAGQDENGDEDDTES